MMPGYNDQKIKARLLVWWILWASILGGLVVIYLLLVQGKPRPPASAADQLQGLVGLVPLFVSIIIRWLALPRFNELSRAFPWFIVGLGLAEACGLLGIFLGGVYRDDLFLLGVLGITQYVPFFARQYLKPKPTGFIPNS